MNRFIKILGGLVIFFIGTMIAVSFLLPTDTIINTISEQVESSTGRKLTIKGDSQLSLFPSLKIELNNVQFANMASGSKDNMVMMDQLAVHIPWLSLLGGEAKLEKFVLLNPSIFLETDTQGHANWQVMSNKSVATASQGSDQQVKQSGPTTLPKGFDISLGEVAIYGGTLTYLDGQTGQTQQLNELELAIELPSLFKPMKLKGGITYQQQRFELNTQIDTLADAIQGNTFNLTQAVDSALFTLEFKGDIAKQGQDIKGNLTLLGQSIKAITQWQSIELNAKDEAFNQFNIQGDMHLKGQQFKLKQFSANLDQLTISGHSTIDFSERLTINANLDLGMLDLNPYLPVPVEQSIPPSSNEDKIAAQPLVWDDSKIDLSALKLLDANITISSTGLIANNIKLEDNQLSVKLDNGQAQISLDKFNAYKGSGTGKINVNARTLPYKLTTQFSLQNIDAQPLLKDAVNFDKVLGKGSINWNFNTIGQSQKQFVSRLNGNLAFNFIDGGVKGANIAQMTRKAKDMLKGDFSSLKDGLNADFDPKQKTDFSALSASFNFVSGVGKNTDLQLASPLIRITGTGEVDLPKTYVNYRLVTGIVDTVEGQASQDKSTGFKVPLRIKGPFHKVDYKLELKKAAQDKAKDKIKDKLKNKLKGLFG